MYLPSVQFRLALPANYFSSMHMTCQDSAILPHFCRRFDRAFSRRNPSESEINELTLRVLQAKKVSAATSQMMEKAAAASTEGVTVLSVVTEDAILYTYHIPGFKSGHTPTLALHDERYLLSKGYESLLHAT